jgi:hypothetical protein
MARRQHHPGIDVIVLNLRMSNIIDVAADDNPWLCRLAVSLFIRKRLQ